MNFGLDIEREGRFEEDYIFKEVIGESDTAYVSRCKNKLDGLDYAVKVQKRASSSSLFSNWQKVKIYTGNNSLLN